MKSAVNATMIAAVLGIAACQGTSASSAPSTAPARTGAPLAAPDAEVVSVPFVRAFDPASVKGRGDKRVEFDAQFGGVIDGTSDLPEKYRSGYVRFSLLGGPGTTDVTRDAVIASERSELVKSLEPLVAVRVRATSVPEVKLVGLKQDREPDVLLLVDSVVPR
jgi:hypothetical protein